MRQKIYFEAVWILITIVLIALFIFPIYDKVGSQYLFYQENIVFILVAVTFGRYIFFLKHHWLYISKLIRVIFIFIPIPIFFYLMDNLYDFQRFLDEKGINSILTHLLHEDQSRWGKYIQTEMLFFWAAAFIANIIMPFRMLFSLSKSYREQS